MTFDEQWLRSPAVEEITKLRALVESGGRTETVVEAAITSLCAITGCLRGALYIADDEGQTLILQSPAFGQSVDNASLRPQVAASDYVGLPGASQSLSVETHCDVRIDSGSELAAGLAMDQLVRTPLMRDGELFGVFLGAGSREPAIPLSEIDGLMRLVVSLLHMHRQSTALERALESERFLTNVQSAMSGEVVNNRPLRQIISRLARECGRPVILEDRLLKALAVAEPDIAAAASLEPYVVADGGKRSTAVKTFLQTLVKTGAAKSPPESLKGFPHDRLMMAVVGASRHLGFLSFVGAPSSFAEIDHRLLKVGATATALKMLYEKVALDVEESIMQDFLCNVVTNNYTTEHAIIEKANYLGYDITLPFEVVVLVWINAQTGSAEVLPAAFVSHIKQKVKEWSPRSIVSSLRNVELFVLVDSDGTLGPQEIAERITEAAQNQIGSPYFCGIGKLAERPQDIKNSFSQAKETVGILQQMKRSNSIETYENLGAYSVLLGVRSISELEGFSLEILGRLMDYDNEKKGELLHTLTVFVTEKGSHEEIAKRLYIHVNTLKYRLQKIQDLLGMSLDNPEERFNVQLAIKALRVSKACRNWG